MLRLLVLLFIASTVAGCSLTPHKDVEERCSTETEKYLNWYDVVISGDRTLSQIEGKYEFELWRYFIDLMRRKPQPDRNDVRQKINAKCLALRLPEIYGPKPRIGMSKREVELSRWGSPYSSNIRSVTTPYGKTECWFYGDYARRSVCFGRDGLVNTITE